MNVQVSLNFITTPLELSLLWFIKISISNYLSKIRVIIFFFFYFILNSSNCSWRILQTTQRGWWYINWVNIQSTEIISYKDKIVKIFHNYWSNFSWRKARQYICFSEMSTKKEDQNKGWNTWNFSKMLKAPFWFFRSDALTSRQHHRYVFLSKPHVLNTEFWQ